MTAKIPNPEPRVAFFDLDRTLITANSGALWLRRERRLGRASAWQLLQGIFYLAAYKFSVIDMDRVMTKALQTIKGETEDNLRAWTRQWYHDEVATRAAPGAWPVIDQHRAAGHTLVLLTSASVYESEVAAAQFGMHHYACTQYEVVEGRFTGNAVAPICFGAGKVERAEALAAQTGADLALSYFYTDSYTDLPMLERVGHPRVVNPDPRLRRLARKRGWQVLDWRGKR